MVQLIIVKYAYGEHLVAEMHMRGCDRRDDGIIWKDNVDMWFYYLSYTIYTIYIVWIELILIISYIDFH